MHEDIPAWVAGATRHLLEAPLTHEIVLAAQQLPVPHADAADRFLAATANWLKTFAEIQNFYSASNQLKALQIVTWNDYEEGTEIESGIENCAVVSARIDGDDLQWSITGRETTKEDTISRYIVFISRNGANLMPLATVAVGVHWLDLDRYRLRAGKYLLFVKAVGVPSIKNHISNAATYIVSNRDRDPQR